MNKKQLTAAIIIFLALLVVCILNLKKEDSDWEKGSYNEKSLLIKNFELNKVAKFAITNGKETAEMAVKKDKWVVLQKNSYPANFAKIKDFMIKIHELKIAQRIRMKKTGLGKLKLLPPEGNKENFQTGTKLAFYDDKDQIIAEMILGEKHYAKENPNPYAPPPADGRYLMVKGKKMPVLITDPLQEVNPNPSLWLDKDFININKIKSVSWTDETGTTQWTIERKDEKSPFALADIKNNEKPNPQKMQGITSAFNAISFTDVFLPNNIDEKNFGLDKAEKISIETFDGITYGIHIGLQDQKAFAKIAIDANFAEKRIPEKDEKPEDKEKLDKEFDGNLTKLKDKLAKEKFYTLWIYEFPFDKVNKALIKHQDLIMPNKENIPNPPNK